jgi:NADP-dependent 3-hydroxy acid dehydrogenase YdfG
MDTMIDTNVKGLVHVTQAVLPGMRARDKGHIINIGSVAGQQAYGNGSIYCGSKAAVASITKALLFETIDTAIRISEINPGISIVIFVESVFVSTFFFSFLGCMFLIH